MVLKKKKMKIRSRQLHRQMGRRQKLTRNRKQEQGQILQTEYDTILEKCQKEFISNRPIDENFFGMVSF